MLRSGRNFGVLMCTYSLTYPLFLIFNLFIFWKKKSVFFFPLISILLGLAKSRKIWAPKYWSKSYTLSTRTLEIGLTWGSYLGLVEYGQSDSCLFWDLEKVNQVKKTFFWDLGMRPWVYNLGIVIIYLWPKCRKIWTGSLQYWLSYINFYGFYGFLIGTFCIFCIFCTFEAWNSTNIDQYCVLNGSYMIMITINDVMRVWDHRYPSNSYFTWSKSQKMHFMGMSSSWFLCPGCVKPSRRQVFFDVMGLNPYFSCPTIKDNALVAG